MNEEKATNPGRPGPRRTLRVVTGAVNVGTGVDASTGDSPFSFRRLRKLAKNVKAEPFGPTAFYVFDENISLGLLRISCISRVWMRLPTCPLASI